MTWPEIQACLENNKHELRVTGKTLEKRLEESDGAVPDAFCATGPLLTFAELSGCAKLAALPDNINIMVNLHELLVANCGLTSLPDSIGSLPLLRTLIVEGNELQQLPDCLFNLPKLHTFNASRNKLQVLPESLVNAKELHYLNISYNELQALPLNLVHLPKLSTLLASHTLVSELPAGISKLTGLTDLQMTHCALTALPQELASAPKLKTLLLDPNPFDDKKLTKVLKEGRLKNILTHIKKHGTPPSAESEAAAAAALARMQLAAAAKRPYELLAVNKAAQYDVYVHPGVKGVRPNLVCAVLHTVNFTAQPGLYEKFIALQTSIHESALCNKRAAAAIGTHDLSKLQLPLHYEALPPADIKFVPLSRDKDAAAAAGNGDDSAAAAASSSSGFQPGQAVSADQLPQYFAGDKTMLKYLSYIQGSPTPAGPLYAVLRDSQAAVLSLPPVINAEHCKVTQHTQQVLIEVSSSESLETAQKAANAFLDQFAEAWAAAAAASRDSQQQQQQEKLQVAPVRMMTHGTGHVRLIFPK